MLKEIPWKCQLSAIFIKKWQHLWNYSQLFWFFKYITKSKLLLSQGFQRLVCTKKTTMYEQMFKSICFVFLYILFGIYEKIFSFFHVVACRNFFTIFCHFFWRVLIPWDSWDETPFHKFPEPLSATGWHFFGIFWQAIDQFAYIKGSDAVITAFFGQKH